MDQQQFEKIISSMTLFVALSSLYFFRLDLSEGWDIAYFALLSGLIGLQVGIRINFKDKKV